MRGRGRRIGPALFAVTAAYDGFFGPGTGSFFMTAFVMLAGFGVLQATAHTRMLNLASNLGSLAVFATSGATWWMIGARLAVRVGGAGDQALVGGHFGRDGAAVAVSSVQLGSHAWEGC